MSEIESKIEEINRQLKFIIDNSLCAFHKESEGHKVSREINLPEVVNVIWQSKWWLFFGTCLFALLGVIYAASLPNKYRSEGVYNPVSSVSETSNLVQQYGGLAALAGIKLDSGSSRVEQVVLLLKSWSFWDGLMARYPLKPDLYAAKSWDMNFREIIYDEEIYDAENKKWIRRPTKKKPVEPTSYEVYKKLRESLNVYQDKDTGLVKISYEHVSPNFSYQVVEMLSREVNLHFQELDISLAEKNIDFLNKKASETGVTELITVLYSLLEGQIKTVMLAKGKSEYVLETVVPPMIEEEKVSPFRAVICVLFMMFGLIFSLTCVLVKLLFGSMQVKK